MLSNSEIQRYNCHIVMPEVGISGQEKIKKSRILMIGAGGLGCPVLQYLTAVGVGTIGIVDYDRVYERNLHRQILYDRNDIGKYKTDVAVKKLSQLNPFVKFNIYTHKLTNVNATKTLEDYDVVIDGSDNFSTRFLVNDTCVMLNKPLVFGAIYKFCGQVSVFNYKNGPTYRCLFPEQPDDDDSPDCASAGVIGILPGIIGTIQANETLKIILEKGEVLSGRLLQFDTLNFNMEIINFSRGADTHSTSPSNLEDTDINTVSFQELKHMQEKQEDILIYDLREQDQFKSYNLGGKCISAEELMNTPDLIPKDKKVIILCEFGVKSNAVVEYLQRVEQMPNVFNLSGGIHNTFNHNRNNLYGRDFR
ncbi:MAG: HesA/MoeB/ThiF family protein [Bacteroidales bacterium]|nr:MAG: HesA/MoeB/ThiF family protein [Bacteroidales bacterium]